MTPTKSKPTHADGFALPLEADTQLGIAMLIAVDEEGLYYPIGLASTIGEARELAQADFRKRLRLLERGDDPGLCPYQYVLWAASSDGEYRIACKIEAASL